MKRDVRMDNLNDIVGVLQDRLDRWYNDGGVMICVAECGEEIYGRDNIAVWGNEIMHVKCLAKHVRRHHEM